MTQSRAKHRRSTTKTTDTPPVEPLNFEVGRAIEYLIANRKDTVTQLLKVAGLTSSGNKRTLEKRLLTALVDGQLLPDQIIEHLDRLEGWGNQHIALLKSTDTIAIKCQDLDYARNQLKSAGFENLLNTERPIGLPAEPTLGQILWTSDHVRFVWVDESTWHSPVPEKNYDENGIHYKAFEIKQKRGVCYFDWDLNCCEAAIMIHEMPTHCYSQIQRKLSTDLEAVLEMSAFEQVALNSLIGNLEKSTEVTRRNLNFVSTRQTKIDFRSKGRYEDAMKDPTAKRARKAMGSDVIGDRGHFYWTTNHQLAEPLPMRVYSREHRFSIHRQCTEDEVRHVMARVRHYCS